VIEVATWFLMLMSDTTTAILELDNAWNISSSSF